MEDDAQLGSSVTLVIDGQEVTGTITSVSHSQIEVTVNIRQPARGYAGTQATVVMGDGDDVLLDLGKHSFYTTMVVVVPMAGKRRPAAPLRVRPADTASEGDNSEDSGEETANTALKPSERRRFFRLGIELEVEVLENVGARKEYVRARGQTLNLSGGGMLLHLDKILLAGVHHFRLNLPKEQMILLGRVIRNEKGLSSTTPVEFVDLHEADRSKLIRYIFKAMRNGKDEDDAGKTEDAPRYWLRRQKFFAAQKPRYW